MSIVTAWVTNIIILILFATVLELLLPNSKMQRYVKLVVGLMLLMVMLQPVLSIFQTDPEEWLSEVVDFGGPNQENQMNKIESKKRDIETVQDAYISEQVAVQLKKQAEGPLIEQFEVVPIEVTMNAESIPLEEGSFDTYPEVHVLIQTLEEAEKEEETDEISIVTIDPVIIENDVDQELEGKTSSIDKDIASLLAREWNVPVDKVHIHWKGGEE
ncbi:stage III sporulation protein AF [Bacillus shivajii]|uniref:stage III sporulation protein AF n=1 Tax=Bacillus shivajii TaxID=1983719 RepID=UPI001CFB53E0|nr:stage III sporulation protein AF [Bacillus shivajii]UCZ54602.1 stage III sporulation protein AF [Bacillus shivajii]